MAEDPKFVVHGSQVQKWTDDIQQLKQERDSFRKQRDELIKDIAKLRKQSEVQTMTNTLEIKLLSENATMPKRANSTDSGLDLYVSETTTIKAGETKAVKTDVAINLTHGYEAQVRPRSGKSLKTKLRVALGTIDQTYNKEIGIITDNIGDEDITVEKGERLAQLVVAPVVYPTPKQVDWFENESDRGAYGSTGE